MLNTQPKDKPMPVPFAARIVRIHVFSFPGLLSSIPHGKGLRHSTPVPAQEEQNLALARKAAGVIAGRLE